MKTNIETMNKNQLEMKNNIAEIQNIVTGKNNGSEAENQISTLKTR